MHYVYIIKSLSYPEKLYIGCTNDLKHRFTEHNNGESYHTKKYVPWKLMAYVALEDQEKAYEFEKYLKSHSGKAILLSRLM